MKPRGAIGRGVSAPRIERARVLAEELAPRLLYSADPAAALLDPGGAQPLHPALLAEPLAQAELAQASSAAQQQRSEVRALVFVDAGVQRLEELLGELAQRVGGAAEIVVLGAERDGIEQISEVLAGYRGELGAVHVFSHGSEQGLQLGASWLSREVLAERADELRGWSSAFAETGDLLLYGCNLAASGQGQALVRELAQLTGADVAASADASGSAALGADWELEYHCGTVESELAGAAEMSWLGTLAAPLVHDASFSIEENSLNGTLVGTVNASAGSVAWRDADWAFRKRLVIDHDQVAADQTDFPLLVSFEGDIDLMAHAQDSGFDLLFTAADGVTKLDHEIESFDGATGKLTAWVRVPALSASADTVLYLYFGNSRPIPDQQNAAGVWDAGFESVHHLNTLRDSTANANHASALGDPEFDLAAGIGGAAYLDGRGDGFTLGDLDALDGIQKLTVSAWVDIDEVGGWRTLIGQVSGGAFSEGTGWALSMPFGMLQPSEMAFAVGSVDPGLFGLSHDGVMTAGLSLRSMQLQHWTAVFDGTATNPYDRIQLYIDGVRMPTVPTSLLGSAATALPVTDQSIYFGHTPSMSTADVMGLLDEVRISTTARSASWIATEHANQSDPSSFLTVGAAESLGGGSGAALNYTIVAGNTGGAFQIDAASGQIRVADESKLDFELARSWLLTVRVNEVGQPALGSDAQIWIALTDVNEFTPQVQTALWSVAEGGSGALEVGQVLAIDGDSAQRLRFSIAGGDPDGIFTIDPLTGELSAAAERLDYDTAQRYELLVLASDDGAPARSGSAVVTVQVQDRNAAPQLVAASPLLPGIDEDETASAGSAVGELLTGALSDSDAGDVHGIALTGLASGNGSWQYSRDGGTSWSDVGVVSDASALLLAPGDRLRFVPDGRNADAGSITYRAWDQSSGSAGDRVDTGEGGGTSAFSAASDVAAIEIAARNDAPSLGDAFLSAAASVGELFGGVFADVDSGASLAGIAVIANPADPAEGLWEYSSDGAHWFAIGAVGEGRQALVLGVDAQLRFSPAPLSSGSSELQVRGLDDSYSGGFSSTEGGSEQRVQLADAALGGVTPLAANVSALAATVTPPPGPTEEPEPVPPTAPAASVSPIGSVGEDTGPSVPADSGAVAAAAIEAAELSAAGTAAQGAASSAAVNAPLALRAAPPASERAEAASAFAHGAAAGELVLPPAAEPQAASTRLGAGAERPAARRPGPRAAPLPAAQLPPLPAAALSDVDRLRELARTAAQRDPAVLSTLAVCTGISVGYLLWLTRGGLLLASVVSSLPAWNVLDPIPVLTRFARRGEGEDDGESLGSMLSTRAAEPAHAGAGAEVHG